MDSEEITPLDIPALYYVYIALNVLHVVVSSALFVWRRNTFPVKGHNVYLTILFAVAVAGISLGGAASGLARADTCTSGTAVRYLCAIVAVNIIAVQAVRLWFEYNFAEEQAQNIQSGDNNPDPQARGWFYSHHKHFKSNRLIGIAVGVSLLELVVGLAVAFTSSSGYSDPLSCDVLLAVMVVICVFSLAACGVLVTAYRRLGNKRDGYGIKSGFFKLCVVLLVFAPVIGSIDLLEGFTDLAAYVQAIQESIRFLTVQLVLLVSIDRPLFLSFRDSDHGALSSVSQDRRQEDGDDADNELVEVISSAADAGDAADLVGTNNPEAESPHEAKVGGNYHAGAEAPTTSDPEVFSSKTLALSLTEILLTPLHAAQLTSFAKHLVGEFAVEPLLFFFKVRGFQKFAAEAHSVALSRTNECELSASVRGNASVDDKGENDADAEIAWRAVTLYFEFLDNDAPSEVNIPHRLSESILEELSAAVVDFRQLNTHTPRDDVELRRPVDTKVFDRAQKNTFGLLERDSFVRWRRAIRKQLDTKQ